MNNRRFVVLSVLYAVFFSDIEVGSTPSRSEHGMYMLTFAAEMDTSVFHYAKIAIEVEMVSIRATCSNPAVFEPISEHQAARY